MISFSEKVVLSGPRDPRSVFLGFGPECRDRFVLEFLVWKQVAYLIDWNRILWTIASSAFEIQFILQILRKNVFVFLLHRRRQNVDPKIRTRYFIVILCKILGKNNYMGDDILRTQQCNQIQVDKNELLFITR